MYWSVLAELEQKLIVCLLKRYVDEEVAFKLQKIAMQAYFYSLAAKFEPALLLHVSPNLIVVAKAVSQHE